MAQQVAGSDAESQIQLTRWILDTRTLWPGSSIEPSASDYMRLLPKAEKEVILKKYHLSDARMALGSALLKRAYIRECTGLDLEEVQFTRKEDKVHGKPCWLPPNERNDPSKSWPYIDFNVSHQNGLVVLVGLCVLDGSIGQASSQDGDIEISVDIVCANERNDMGNIASSDFAQFVSTFEYIFSDSELFNLTYSLPEKGSLTLLSGEKIPNSALGRADRAISLSESIGIDVSYSTGTEPNSLKETRQMKVPSELIIESKLRNFYASFSLKEAYFKLGGEGIAANWIKECEFNNVRAPEKGGVPRCSLDGTWGERIVHDSRKGNQETTLRGGTENDDLEMVLKGEPIQDVLVELQGFEENFIICTMLKTKTQALREIQEFPMWQRIDVERDLYPGSR